MRVFSKRERLQLILQSPTLSKSDLVLCLTSYLSAVMPEGDDSHLHLLDSVVYDYLSSDYLVIFKALRKLMEIYADDDLLDLIKTNKLIGIERPDTVYSRRYFENAVSSQLQDSYTEVEYASVQRLLNFAYHYVGRGKPDYSVDSVASVYRALVDIKAIGKTCDIEAKADALRARSVVSKQKSRIERPAGSQVGFSAHPGLFPVHQPTPVSLRTELGPCHLTDRFTYNTLAGGLSLANPETPYVNSVSGTCYKFTAWLDCYIAEALATGGEHDQLQSDVNHVFSAFVITCSNQGWHSLNEIQMALMDPIVKAVFDQYDMSVQLKYVYEIVHDAFYDAADYSAQLHLQAVSRDELLKSTKRVPAEVYKEKPKNVNALLAKAMQRMFSEKHRRHLYDDKPSVRFTMG